MKTKKVLLFAFCLLCFQGYAQKKDKTPAKNVVSGSEHELNIYNTALQFGDYEAAKNAVYVLMEKHPEVNAWLDTLTRLYFAIGANNQTALSGMACLKKDTSDTGIMEMVAIADNALNRIAESLEMYEKLQSRKKSPYYAYQVAYGQYHLKFYVESCKTLEGIIKDTATDSQSINITMSQDRSQKIPLKAAAYNLLGVAQLDLNLNDKAKANFESALKIDPDFVLAKENAAIADKPKEGAANPAPAEKK